MLRLLYIQAGEWLVSKPRIQQAHVGYHYVHKYEAPPLGLMRSGLYGAVAPASGDSHRTTAERMVVGYGRSTAVNLLPQ